VVVPIAGAKVELPSLADHCAVKGLSRHKSPERLEVVDALPRNLTGKVLKAELRARYG
jgi:non-ribosomal peptide synthetase component E (peptide arylation enzyme)